MIIDDLIRTAGRIRVQARTGVSRLAVGLTIGLVLATAGVSRAADGATPAPASFTDGQKVQVREGDTWSAATILKREGRRYLVHYDGADAASDEWVTTERLRLPGPAGSA